MKYLPPISIQNIEETGLKPIITQPPKIRYIAEYLQTANNGKAPRIDGIDIELIYHALMGMIREIKSTLQGTWMTTNTIERETIRIILPEYKKPKQTIGTSHCAVSVTHSVT